MSDAWNEIQAVKSKRNSLRERLEKRKKERQDILGANSTASASPSPAAAQNAAALDTKPDSFEIFATLDNGRSWPAQMCANAVNHLSIDRVRSGNRTTFAANTVRQRSITANQFESAARQNQFASIQAHFVEHDQLLPPEIGHTIIH